MLVVESLRSQEFVFVTRKAYSSLQLLVEKLFSRGWAKAMDYDDFFSVSARQLPITMSTVTIKLDIWIQV